MQTRLSTHLQALARDRADVPAVVTAQGQWSYAELLGRVLARAETLQAAGVTAASTVGVACTDDAEHLLTALATACLGADGCTLTPHEPLEQQAMRLGATHVVDDSLTCTATGARGASDAPDAHVLFATSGTTGTPKIVVLRDDDLLAQAPRHVEPGAHFACLAGMAHNFAKRHRLYCVLQGATNVFLDAPAGELATAMRTLSVDVLHVSAYQAQALLAEPGLRDLPPWQLKTGGSPVSPALRQQLRAQLTPDLRCGYGTTESGAIAFSAPDNAPPDTDVGLPLPGLELRVVADDGSPCPADNSGEIQLRGDGLFRGYRGRSDSPIRDGWLHTGDVGRLDAAGRLTVEGRLDDLFVFNSMNIVPQQLEDTLRGLPGVADAAVVPKASPVHGDIPVALLVAEPGTAPDMAAIKRAMRAQHGLRSPRHYQQVDQIPRNAAGKILRDTARRHVD